LHEKELYDVISCVSMLSMTKQLVCMLEVLQPQPNTTVPELN